MNAQTKTLKKEIDDFLKACSKRQESQSQIMYENGFLDCIIEVVSIPGLPNTRFISEHLLQKLKDKNNGQATELIK